jgi:hypothetical protein
MKPQPRLPLWAGLLLSGGIAFSLASVPAAGSAGQPVSLYVSPQGNDAWSGHRADPDNQGADGPFATLARARDELRRLKAAGELAAGAVVYLGAGTYRLSQPLSLGATDSGLPEAPIVWRADEGRRVTLTAALPVNGFKPWKDRILVADLRGGPLEKTGFGQLFFRGRRQVLARYPNVDPNDPHFGQWAYVLASDPAAATNQSVSDNVPQVKDHFTATSDVTRPTAGPGISCP